MNRIFVFALIPIFLIFDSAMANKPSVLFNELSIYYVYNVTSNENINSSASAISIRYSFPSMLRGFSISFSQTLFSSFSKTVFTIGISPFFPISLMREGDFGRTFFKEFYGTNQTYRGCGCCCLGTTGFLTMLILLFSETYFEASFDYFSDSNSPGKWYINPSFTINLTFPLWFFFKEKEKIKYPIYLKAGCFFNPFTKLYSPELESSGLNFGFSVCF